MVAPQQGGSQTTVTTKDITVKEPFFDPSYLVTIHGMLKAVEAVLDMVCFACIVAGPKVHHSGTGWAAFVSMVAFITTTMLLFLYLMHVIEILRSVPWLLVEMVYCAVWAFLYLTAASTMAAGASNAYSILPKVVNGSINGTLPHSTVAGSAGAWAAASFFGFVLLFVYAVDSFLKFRAMRNGELAQGAKATVITTTQTYGGHQQLP